MSVGTLVIKELINLTALDKVAQTGFIRDLNPADLN